jgi:hypothetical protein
MTKTTQERISAMDFIQGLVVLLLATVFLVYNFFPFSPIGHLFNSISLRNVPNFWFIKIWPLVLVPLATWLMFFKEQSMLRLHRYSREYHPYRRFLNLVVAAVGATLFSFSCKDVYGTGTSDIFREITLGIGVLLLALGWYIELVTERFRNWDNGIALLDKILGYLSISAGFMMSFLLLFFVAVFVREAKDHRD